MRNLLLAVSAAGAMAVATSAFGQAIVVDDLNCDFLDADGGVFTIMPPAGGGDAVVNAVLTPSGNANFSCSGTLPDGATLPGADGFPSKAVLWDFDNTGFTCQTSFGVTEDWHMVVTRSGRASVTCHLNAQE